MCSWQFAETRQARSNRQTCCSKPKLDTPDHRFPPGPLEQISLREFLDFNNFSRKTLLVSNEQSGLVLANPRRANPSMGILEFTNAPRALHALCTSEPLSPGFPRKSILPVPVLHESTLVAKSGSFMASLGEKVETPHLTPLCWLPPS